MSTFLKLLEDVRRGGQGFGFTARIAGASPALAMLAVLPGLRPDLVEAASGAADAVGLEASLAEARAGDSALSRCVAAAGKKPCGLWLTSTGGEELPSDDWLRKAGVDFVVVSPEHPATMLTLDVAKLAQARLDMDPMDVRALDAVAVDGLIIPGVAEGPTGLSIAQAARYRLFAGLTGKPILVTVSASQGRAELRPLMQVGVDGVVLTLAALGEDKQGIGRALARLKDEIVALGPRRVAKARGGASAPLLPLVSADAPDSGQEEEGE